MRLRVKKSSTRYVSIATAGELGVGPDQSIDAPLCAPQGEDLGACNLFRARLSPPHLGACQRAMASTLRALESAETLIPRGLLHLPLTSNTMSVRPRRLAPIPEDNASQTEHKIVGTAKRSELVISPSLYVQARPCLKLVGNLIHHYRLRSVVLESLLHHAGRNTTKKARTTLR